MSHRESKDFYDVALICKNGHLINAESRTCPQDNTRFCTRCGAEAIDACEKCNTPIRGYHHIPGVADGYWSEEDIPKHCHECGHPYPWIKEAVDSWKEIVHTIDKLSIEEKNKMESSIEDLINETPKTQIAVLNLKLGVKKIPQEAWGVMKEILINIASESAKRQLGL